MPALATNFVDVTSDQSIGGNKTFTSTINGNISGSAASALTAGTAGSAATLSTPLPTTQLSGAVAIVNGGTGADTTNTPANQVFASPNGSTGAPTMRSLVSADLPTAQATRTICYVAGSDNATTATALTTNDSQPAFFRNMIGALTLAGANSVWCQTNSGSATINLTDDATPFLGTALTCTTGGASGTSSLAIATGDVINFQLASIASGAPIRITVCFSATVN